jgi:DNA polymerase-3 subunit delta
MAKGSCYVFLGPELGEKQDAINEIRKKLKSPEETSFYAGETPVPEILAFVQNASLFAESRLIFIKNADAITKKDETEAVAAYLKRPQDDTTLVLISDATNISKTIENQTTPGNKKVFYELFENRKSDWIAAFFKRQGRSITPDGIEMLLELVENNTDTLRQECTRLILFFDKDTRITGEEVEKVLSHTRQESAFSLFSRIAAGDLSRSLESLHSLLSAKESPQAILAGLAWCFRKLRDYSAALESGDSTESALNKAGIRVPKSRKDYEAAGKRYNADTCLSTTAEYDVLLRSSGSALESVLMDRYLCRIIVK